MFLAAMMLAGLPPRADAAPGKATVQQQKGSVTASRQGADMFAGDSIATGADGQAVLSVNGDLVVVAPDSKLAIERNEATATGIETVTDVLLDLSAGRIYGRVERAAALSSFVVRIPKGQVKIDASRQAVIFDISADGHVSLAQGSAEVMYNRGDTEASLVMRRLESSQSFDPETGDTGSIAGEDAKSLESMVADAAPAPPPGTEEEVAATFPGLDEAPIFVSPNLPAPRRR